MKSFIYLGYFTTDPAYRPTFIAYRCQQRPTGSVSCWACMGTACPIYGTANHFSCGKHTMPLLRQPLSLIIIYTAVQPLQNCGTKVSELRVTMWLFSIQILPNSISAGVLKKKYRNWKNKTQKRLFR